MNSSLRFSPPSPSLCPQTQTETHMHTHTNPANKITHLLIFHTEAECHMQ